jgi:hypothetical protein
MSNRSEEFMKPEDMNPLAMRICLWAGAVLVFNLILSQHIIIGFVPPPSPELSADQLADIFRDRKDRITLGCIIQCITWSLYGLWATPIVLLIRKTERTWPLFTYASLIHLGCCMVFFILVPMTWAVIAFRAHELPPFVIQIMNDWVWFDWLYTWPPYSVWMFILSGAMLLDRNEPTIFPRWLGYFNMWCGILIVPACTIGLFTSGPFAYDGLISFWLAAIVFFGWMIVMTYMTFRAIAALERRIPGREASAVATHEPIPLAARGQTSAS